MDIQVLNDARTDLSLRMAQLDIPKLNRTHDGEAANWDEELSEMERRHDYSVIEATLEYYIAKATDPRCISGLGVAVQFYLDSLLEWQTIGCVAG